ncbi:hypothetical protein [Labrys wisconsinensis]|uniref:Uncharacterized protein n=1 Tax=Labrys wisconsinensis TaxID=425677 RepID=A0ABU0JC68_9HYPH|nr:hypothetical protein [Labrys wisconsinensis]MDQ0471874.1 hypothetical protein [Labrys wisconsinensis]
MAVDAKDVIGWAVSIASTVVGIILPAYMAWAPPWLVDVYLWLTSLAVLIWGGWNLRRWWSAPPPRSMLSWRFGGIVAALAAIVFVVLPVAWSTTHATMANGTLAMPKVKILAKPGTIRTTETTQLAVALDDKPADGATCAWTVDARPSSPDCKLPYRPEAGARGPVPVTVQVTNADGWDLGTASLTLLVTYEGVAEISPLDATGFVGDEARWSAALDGHAIGADQTCRWQIDDGDVIPSVLCQAAYTAQDKDVGAHRINVTVSDSAGKVIARSATNFTVKAADPVYSEYVIDASARMARKTGSDTLLQRVVANLSSSLDDMASGYVGVAVASDAAGAAAAPCDNARELWRMQPLIPLREALRTALGGLTTGSSQDVPLAKAIKIAFFTLAASGPADADRILTVFTAGADTCRRDRADIGTILSELEAANPGVRLTSLLSDYRALALTVGIAFTEEDRRQWRAQSDLFRLDEAATVVLTAGSEADLRLIQDALARFSAPRRKDRTAACLSLIRLGDERDQKALRIYCQRL